MEHAGETQDSGQSHYDVLNIKNLSVHITV